MFPFLHVSMSHVYVSMFPCLHLRVSMSPCVRNSANGKRQLLLVCCKRKTETENFCLFAAKRKRKTEIFFCLVGN
jgi:hypothetical protein